MAWGFTSVGWEHLSSMYEALDLKPSTAYCVLWLRLEAGGLMKYQLQLCSSQWLTKPNWVRTPTSEVFYWYCGGLYIVTLKLQTSLDSQRTGWGLFRWASSEKGELGKSVWSMRILSSANMKLSTAQRQMFYNWAASCKVNKNGRFGDLTTTLSYSWNSYLCIVWYILNTAW